MKKTLGVIISLMLVALMSVSVFAAYPASPDWEFPLPADGVNLVTAGGTLIGEAAGWDGLETTGYTAAFDGDETTFYDPTAMATETAYIGVQMAEPYMLTEIRILPRDGWTARFLGASIQGSNDGTTWTTIWESYIEAPAIDYYCFTPTSDYSAGDTEWTAQAEGYTMFRYFNYVSHGDVAEVELYGNPAGGAAAAPAAEAAAAPADTRENLALNKAVTVSSVEAAGMEEPFAVDGDVATRWASAYEDPTTFQVDLGAVYAVDKVVLNWETASSSDYKIYVSTDAANWTEVAAQTGTVGPVIEVKEFTPVNAQYVKLESLARATEWGNSLYEFEVYGNAAAADAAAAPAEAAPAEAAPVETAPAAQTADTVIAAAALCLVAGAVIVISKKSK